MAKTVDSKSFRAQLVLPEQRQLFDYWLSQRRGDALPARRDINPAHIPKILPGISLVEVGKSIENCRIRLAGTRLREVYDREITGMHFVDFDWGEKRDYWLTAYKRTINEQLPTQGVVRGPRRHKDHLVQYWLKLPLCKDGDSVEMVLCLDNFLPASTETYAQKLASA